MFATDGSVSSQNVVGYQGMSITADLYYMITAQVDATTGDGTGMAVKDLVKGNIPYGSEMQVRLPAGGYQIYKYKEEAYDESTDEFLPGWADNVDNLATAKVAPGAAFWFKSSTACEVTIAGSVLAEASKTVNVNASIFSMIGNAYPADVNPNDVTWTGLSFNDELQVRLDAGGYNIYKYKEEAYDESTDEFMPGWADNLDNLVTDTVLKSGRGAWIKPASAVSVTWESPIK